MKSIITHFPISRNPSITFNFFGPENDVAFVSSRSGLPGWTSMPNVNPKQTLNTDVRTKYTIVRTATLPFLLMSKLAAPENNYCFWRDRKWWQCRHGRARLRRRDNIISSVDKDYMEINDWRVPKLKYDMLADIRKNCIFTSKIQNVNDENVAGESVQRVDERCRLNSKRQRLRREYIQHIHYN